MKLSILQKRIEDVEAAQFVLFSLLISSSPNRQMIIEAVKKLEDELDEEKKPIPPHVKELLFSIIKSVENVDSNEPVSNDKPNHQKGEQHDN
jgi:transcription termination factor NusB